MALAVLLTVSATAQYAGGNGEPDTPYLIATVQDLLDLSKPDNGGDCAPACRQSGMIQ